VALQTLIGHNAEMTSHTRHGLTFATLSTIVAFTLPAHAWNALGHKVVAEIAWQDLTPEKRQEIVHTLRFMRGSCISTRLRCYVDLEAEEVGGLLRGNTSGNNSPFRLKRQLTLNATETTLR
jgi:hypothetical protein